MTSRNLKKRTLAEEMEYDTDEFEIDTPEFKLTRETERKIRYNSFEMVMRQVGLFGRYQIFCCFVVQYATILWAGNDAFQMLGFMEPDWFCPDNNETYTDLGDSSGNSQCGAAMNCSKLTPTNVKFHSALIDFNLICDRAHIKDVLITCHLLGRLFGAIIGGHMGDYVGRKKTFFAGQFLITITSALTIGSMNWQTLAVFQTLNGFFFGIIEATSFALMIEYTDSKYRLIPNACFQWILGYMVVALITWLDKDWRRYLIFINLASSPLFIGFLLFLESPRWLVAKNNLDEAAEILNDLSGDRWNNTHVKFRSVQLSRIPRDKSNKFYNITDLFSTKQLALQSVLQMLATLSYSLVSAVFLINVDSIDISISSHYLLYGILRLWVPIIAIIMDFKLPRFGRKHLFLTCCSAVGLCFGVIVIALLSGMSTDHPFIYAVALIGTSINVSGLYIAIMQITLVVYPTVMRSIAFGTLTLTDDVGTLISTLFMSKILVQWQAWPYVIAEFLIILTYILALWFQPETKFRPLPDIMEQVQT